MQTLDVVNAMLGTMGERPLNSLTDTHALLTACLLKLSTASEEIQTKGWWFNREVLKVLPSASDQNLYLPNDTLDIRADDPRYVKRGNRIYNTVTGAYTFTEATSLTVALIRSIPFDDLPPSAQQYIANVATLKFQLDYDGDTTKSQALASDVNAARINISKDETRHTRANLIDNNPRLNRIKFVTRGARRWY